MQLISQHAKSIMEGCKKRARDAGLVFDDETLEYIVTNRDMIELSPKVMIPTLYDYWVHDVRVLSGKGMYELYPNNPFETVINTRPAISFYNDNNPDWLNVMIFYHVLGHIDFFQNNLFFRHTWDYDFTGQALADKRLIARYRSEKGRWVDYIIEFARSVDNLVGYHHTLSRLTRPRKPAHLSKLDYYFDMFLQSRRKVSTHVYQTEIERYNELNREGKDTARDRFLADVTARYPEFEAVYQRYREKKPPARNDVMQYIMTHSIFLNQEENKWAQSIMEVVRNTSLFLQPQMRTKIMNEGWASYWHETLFALDDRIRGHEVDFARINAGVTAMPKVGLNPYALGMRLFFHIESMGNRGCYGKDYQSEADQIRRRQYDAATGSGRDLIFSVRENLCDFTFVNQYVDQEFMDEHDLFTAGRRLNRQRQTWEYYIRSRRAEAYRQMVIDTLPHPPFIVVDEERSRKGPLYLVHRFEGKPLKTDYIENTMVGIAYLWGGPVHLETSEPMMEKKPGTAYVDFWTPPVSPSAGAEDQPPPKIKWKRVVYVMDQRKLTKREI